MTSRSAPPRILRDPATGDVHHVEDGVPGYDGWEDCGPLDEDHSPYVKRWDDRRRRYVEDHGWAERRLRSVRGEYQRLARVSELAALANIPAEVVEAIEAKRRGPAPSEEGD